MDYQRSPLTPAQGSPLHNHATISQARAQSAPPISSPFADAHLHTRPIASEHYSFPAEVHHSTQVAPNLIRITLSAPHFRHHALSGPDEFFGLIMPPSGHPFTPPPLCESGNIRASIAMMPKDTRPELRWYTIRALDATQGLMSFDVATHGITEPYSPNIGPGLRWCLTARHGDEAGIWTAQGLWHREHRHQLLIADPSALPSALSILNYLARFHPSQLESTHLIVVAEGNEDIEHEELDKYVNRLGSARTLFTSPPHFPQATRHALDEIYVQTPVRTPDYIWVAGEGDLCKAVRRYAIQRLELPARSVQWCPYWFLGRARP